MLSFIGPTIWKFW